MKRSALRVDRVYFYSTNARDVTRPTFQKVRLASRAPYVEAGRQGNREGNRLLTDEFCGRAVKVELVNPTLGYLNVEPGITNGWNGRCDSLRKAVLPIHLWSLWDEQRDLIFNVGDILRLENPLSDTDRERIEMLERLWGTPMATGAFAGDLYRSNGGILYRWNGVHRWTAIAIGDITRQYDLGTAS